MIPLETIRNYYPAARRDLPGFGKLMLKEYIQLLILDYLSTSLYVRKITFIGGTCIRFTKGIDRFSEDLDFDCKDFPFEEFTDMTDRVLQFLQRNGLQVEARDDSKPRLKAFRRSYYFPQLLLDLGLTGHRDERFLIKVECQDQQVPYKPETVNIKGCGLFFPIPVPSDSILCAMKVSAMLDRRKGRDFYDAMFLLSQSLPDFGFLSQKINIASLDELKAAAGAVIRNTDLEIKRKDFEHLLFDRTNSAQILRVAEFFDSLD